MIEDQVASEPEVNETNLITFEPPIDVNPDVIPGGMVVVTADIHPQDDPTQVVAMIFGDGRVIGVPFVESNENSIRVALS